MMIEVANLTKSFRRGSVVHVFNGLFRRRCGQSASGGATGRWWRSSKVSPRENAFS